MTDTSEQNSPAPDTGTPFDLTGETEREQMCHAAGFSGAYEMQERKAAALVEALLEVMEKWVTQGVPACNSATDQVQERAYAALAAWEGKV